VVYAWHVVISYTIWAWVVRRLPLPVLLRWLPRSLLASVLLGVLDTLPPMLEQNFGAVPQSSCYLLRAWRSGHTPMPSVLIDKMLLLPLACLVIAAFNFSTVRYMARKAREAGHVRDPAAEKLKVRSRKRRERGCGKKDMGGGEGRIVVVQESG
jgi:hypothetical protein